MNKLAFGLAGSVTLALATPFTPATATVETLEATAAASEAALDDDGIALHAGALPDHPASHGCVRLPAKFAAKLYGVTKVGSTVMIGA